MLFIVFFPILCAGICYTNSCKMYPNDLWYQGAYYAGSHVTQYPPHRMNNRYYLECERIEFDFYRNLNHPICAAKWCQTGTMYIIDDTTDHYSIMHIISNTTHNTDCNLDMIGNYLFVYNKWDQELQNLDPVKAIEEKQFVLGNIYKRAIASVTKCKPGCKITEKTNPKKEAAAKSDNLAMRIATNCSIAFSVFTALYIVIVTLGDYLLCAVIRMLIAVLNNAVV